MQTPIPGARLALATLFVVSCSVLMLEVALTRVFSFVLWYHMTYLVVGLALLGYGAAGTALATRGDLVTANFPRTIGRNCAMFALLSIVAFIATVRLPRNADAIFEGQYKQIFPILLTHLLLAFPFYFAGKAIGFVLMRNRESTNRLYSADLLGAGAGSLLAVILINQFGAVAVIFLAATMTAGVAVAAARTDRLVVKTLVVALAIVLLSGTAVSTKRELVHLQPAPGKDMGTQPTPIAFTQWNILNRIDLTEPTRESFWFGGVLSDRYKEPPPSIRIVYQDATAPTALVHVEGTPETYSVLGDFLQGAPYAIRQRPPSVLVLGFGGGIDGLIAEHAGAGHVTGVDINPITVDLVSHRYRDFSSGLFEKGNLKIVLSEGRHYLTRSNEKFDVIQLSGVDTFAALSTGSLALSESYLYTSEAVNDLLNHLGPNGVLSYSRWLFSPPREALRLVVTVHEALRLRGVADPRTHIVVVSGGPPTGEWADTMVKNVPFTQAEIQELRSWAEERHFHVLYDPFSPQTGRFDGYLNASESDQKKFVDSYMFDISPSRDDKPFFFQFYRWENIWNPVRTGGMSGYLPGNMPRGIISLLIAFGEMFFFSLIFVVVPLARQKSTRWPARQGAAWLPIFAGLGLGFIMIEMVLMQKFSIFLGGPAYSMAVTLFSLLVFSGLGSRFSEKLSNSSFRAIAWMIAGLLVIQGLELAFLDWGLPHVLGLSQIARCAVAVAAIAPLGLSMGMPFPTLLTKVGVTSETLIPWAWGVNSCATVLGSVLSTIASMILGLNFTWLVAMGIYVLVFLLVASRRIPEQPVPDADSPLNVEDSLEAITY